MPLWQRISPAQIPQGRESCISPWSVARPWLSPPPRWRSVLSVPAHAAGTAVGIKKLGTVNVREAAAAAQHAQYRPALRNLPAAKQFAALEERRNAEAEALRKPAPVLQPPTVAGQRITSNEVQAGFEGLDIRDTVFSQGFEVEPPDQGLCGGTFGPTTFLWEEVNLAIGLFDTQQNQYTPPGARPERAVRRAAGVRRRHGQVRAVPRATRSATSTRTPAAGSTRCWRLMSIQPAEI